MCCNINVLLHCSIIHPDNYDTNHPQPTIRDHTYKVMLLACIYVNTINKLRVNMFSLHLFLLLCLTTQTCVSVHSPLTQS